jgi:broad specificity phosphatase PhoE
VTTEIVFETHAISTDNDVGIATGWLEGQLSGEGRRLARRLGERRRGEWIDAVYTSDLSRAVETAELAFGDSGIPIRQDARLRECNYGALNGGPVFEVESERPSNGRRDGSTS